MALYLGADAFVRQSLACATALFNATRLVV